MLWLWQSSSQDATAVGEVAPQQQTKPEAPHRKSHIGVVKSSGIPAAIKARARKYEEKVAHRGEVQPTSAVSLV